MKTMADFMKIPILGVVGLALSYIINTEPIEVYRWIVLTITLLATLYQVYKTYKKK